MRRALLWHDVTQHRFPQCTVNGLACIKHGPWWICQQLSEDRALTLGNRIVYKQGLHNRIHSLLHKLLGRRSPGGLL
jgi:hypothetical protein